MNYIVITILKPVIITKKENTHKVTRIISDPIPLLGEEIKYFDRLGQDWVEGAYINLEESKDPESYVEDVLQNSWTAKHLQLARSCLLLTQVLLP